MQEPPRPGDVAPYVEDDQPATIGQLKSTRRWLAVAAVWAVAATALGVFALLEANKDDDNNGQQTQAAGDLARVQKNLSDRIDELESRIDDLPSSDDLSNLDGRVKDVESKADGTSSDVDKLNGQVDDLEQRVQELESNQSQTDTTTTP